MILEERTGLVQAILVTFQCRMLHVLICKTDVVPVILCGCEIWYCVKRRAQIDGLWEQDGEENIWC